MTITVESFDGHDVQDATYESWLEIPDRPYARVATPVRVNVPGGWPRHIRVDYQPRVVLLHVAIIGGDINDGQRQLQEWFAVGTEGPLVMTEDSVSKALDCVVTRAERYAGSPVEFVAQLEAADPRWRTQAAVEEQATITASGQQLTATNPGNATDDQLVIVAQQTAQKAAANGPRHIYEVLIANRSPRALRNYAVELTGGGWNHAAECAAVRSLTSGNDVRVYADGRQIPRWAGEHATTTWNQAGTRLWANLTVPPRKRAELLEAITAGSPADGGDLAVERGGTEGWPESGVILVESTGEAISYSGKTQSNASGKEAFTGIVRGVRNSTAASASAGDELFWLAVRVQIVTGWTGATAPDARADLKPMLDLASASLANARHIWANFIDDDNPGRSMQWMRELRASDDRASRILVAKGGVQSALAFEYAVPAVAGLTAAEAGKPNFNNYRYRLPVPVNAASNALGITRVVNDTLALLLYGEDEAGNESLLATHRGALSSSAVQLTPAADLYGLRLQCRSQVVVQTPVGSVASSLTLTTAYSVANSQQVTVHGDGYVRKVACLLAADAGGADTAQMQVWSDNGSNAPLAQIASEVASGTIAAGSGTAWYEFALASALPVRDGEKLWIRLKSTNGLAVWVGYTIHFAEGQQGDGTAGRRLQVRLISDDLDFEELAEADDGDVASGDVIDLTLDADLAPYVDMQAREDDVVQYRNAILSNESTAQEIRLDDVLVRVDDELQIDVAARTVENITTGEVLTAGVSFSDPSAICSWIPGDNVFELNDDGVVGCLVTVRGFGRWE